jgi:DNA-binding SARP family transcriptional activator
MMPYRAQRRGVLVSARRVTAARAAKLRRLGKRKGREAVVLRVGVLGPVAAWDGDRQLQVGQPRQQAVLAILSMRANRVISRSELVDAVWGHEAPHSAEGSVYTYIAGLRRVFEPGRSLRGPGRILVSSGAGYVLHLVPGQPDAVSFEQHLHRARQLRKTGDLAGAVTALESALGLWRGVVAFAGVPGPFAETERVRLGELRSAVSEERADAMLGLGRHEEILADLTAMVAENPLRERMRGLLMLALYRSGRQAEALRVFAEGRRVLAEELGIDPGAELSRIHQQVLTTDPALDITQAGQDAAQTQVHAQVEAPARAAGEGIIPVQQPADRQDRLVPVPAQLPPDAPGFSGRHEELGMLHGMLANHASGQAPLVVISGTAGVGKTALAIRFGRQVARRFPDGQLYLNLRGFDPRLAPLEPAQALRFVLGALGVTPLRMPPDLEARVALFRSIADGKRMLVVLDNAASPAQVRPLLPGSADTLVIVTSRNEMAGLVATDGAQPISLDVLSYGEAHELLDYRLTHDRVVADPQAADEIIESCARLPLALSIAVGRAAARPRRSLAQVATELKEARGGLDALDEDDDVTDVRAVFSWSYDQLSEPARRMFRLLGIHPGPDISLTAAASLAGTARQSAGAALRELVRTHMVAEPVHSRYSFHDLLRAYAADLSERLDLEDDRRAAARRVLDHYLHSALAAGSRLQPRRWGVRPPEVLPGVVPVEVTDREQATAWFEAECPVLLALIGFAESQGFDEHAWLIPWAATVFLNRSGRHQDWVAAQRTAVAAARRLGDRNGQAHSQYLLGYALSTAGDNAAAEPCVRRSLELFRELGDRGHEAMVLNGLAVMMSQEGRHKEALDVAQDGLRMVKAAGFWWVQGTLENTVGGLYGSLGEFEQGLAHCQRAIALHREAGNFAAAGWDIQTIGDIYRQRGDLAQARISYRQALEVHRDVGAPFDEATTLNLLGDTLAELGEEPEAIRTWQAAQLILDRLAHPLADDIRAKLTAAGEHAEPDRITKSLTTGR